MIACFDAGNSRLKWGLADIGGWQDQGAVEWLHLENIAAVISCWPRVEKAYWVSVTETEAEMALFAVLSALLPNVPLTRVAVTVRAGGVANFYDEPETLGEDRWCAMIGARAQEKRACLVATVGTATTIDSLDESGQFLGGMILPGPDMMKNALFRGTARLPLPPSFSSGQFGIRMPQGMLDSAAATNAIYLLAGHRREFPKNTPDAIMTGCMEAQAGAIERAFHRLPNAAICLVSGGAAPLLVSMLKHIPFRVVPYLVLEGLRQLALESGEL